jgi:predicted nucleic acid-binding protein
MTEFLVDSNVILDVFLNDPTWARWSEATLEKYSRSGILVINDVIYAEISIGFERIEELEKAVAWAGFHFKPFPREALFLAGKAFLRYRKQKGLKKSPLPDFFIGAQAAVMKIDLITRDVNRYRTYFPTVNLISPDSTESGSA